MTGVRYYTFAGKIIGESTGQSLYWTEENTQGTLTVAVNAFTPSDPVIRRTVTRTAPRSPAAGTAPGRMTGRS